MNPKVFGYNKPGSACIIIGVNIAVPLLLSFLAGICTLLGALLFLFARRFSRSYICFAFGLAAGAMIYLSFVELFPISVRTIGFANTNLAFFLGVLVIGLIDMLLPQHLTPRCVDNSSNKNQKLMVGGLFTAIGIGLHNFPEGISVFFGSLAGARSGILLALSTALHNIPEGIAVAIPIYLATKNKKKAVLYSFLSGIAEPIGALLAYAVLRPYVNAYFLGQIFAFAAGIMVYISLDELLPSCFENCRTHKAIIGIVLGMIIIAISINLIR